MNDRQESEDCDPATFDFRWTCADCARFDWERMICGGPGPTYSVIAMGRRGQREAYFADWCKQFVLRKDKEPDDADQPG
jgi:hypothetical protein